MNDYFYYAYGSNIHPAWLSYRVSSAKIIDIVQLTGWSLCFHKASKDNSAKCNIIETGLTQDSVYGVIYCISQIEKAKLDRIEAGYYPDSFNFNGYDNVRVYRAIDEYIDEQLLPYTWYKDIIISGAEYHHFPGEYISYIQSFDAITDPDLKRDNEKRAIINGK